MKKHTIYSALYSDDCYPFTQLAANIEVARVPEDLKEPNSLLVVWGGADISPSFYGHETSRRTWDGGQRDGFEWALMQEAIKKGIPIIGVCRGAQMLCAAAGGFLLQHVENHAGARHQALTPEGQTFQVNSIHHQMMAGLEKVDHELLAWVPEPLSPNYIYRNDKLFEIPKGFKEPEFVYFPKIKGHAIQWHPEAMDMNSEATQYVLQQIRKRIA